MKNEITAKSLNSELAEAFKEELNSKECFLYSIEPTSNPDYIMCHFAQQVSLGGNNVTFTALALGWADSTILRVMQNFNAAYAKEFKVGMTALEIFQIAAKLQNKVIESNEAINICLEESTIQRTWVNKDGSEGGAKAKINPSTGEVILYNEKPIYRYTYFVQGKPEHKLLNGNSTDVAQSIIKGQSPIEDLKKIEKAKELLEEPEEVENIPDFSSVN